MRKIVQLSLSCLMPRTPINSIMEIMSPDEYEQWKFCCVSDLIVEAWNLQ